MNAVINWELLKHPYNWVVVILMLVLGVYALSLLAEPIGQVGGLMQVY